MPSVAEARRNYLAYKEKYKDKLEREHLGRIAMLHDQELVNVYNDMDDAYSIGVEKYGLGNFSLQRIGQQPIELGILAAAIV